LAEEDGVIQLVRESPPGYGGVERVAHELATAFEARGMACLTLWLRPAPRRDGPPPLPVRYRCQQLPGVSVGRLQLPLPHPRLLRVLGRREPLHVHLPCPTLLALSVVARLLRPRRPIRLYWHAFLDPEPGLQGWVTQLYQWLALRWAAVGPDRVITTSPALAEALRCEGIPSSRLAILPCCLSAEAEAEAAVIRAERRQGAAHGAGDPCGVIFIGRLASYKRVDWLIEAFHHSPAARLHIVGDGPQRRSLERLAAAGARADSIVFHGQLDEREKFALLAASELLVLPADRCNEGFGIAQLEAMACGVPALAFARPRSGMAWVGRLEESLEKEGPEEDEIGRLRRILERLVNSPATLKEMADLAQHRYDHLFARPAWERQLAAVLGWSC
jgi:glycosyltransferase involved in cell wall biosynthesis